MALQYFSWVDYTVFSIITGLGCAIGVYFGFYKKQDTANNYLFGGKNMKWFPVSMSLVSSALSGFSLLGLPTEMYLFGTQVSIMVISILIAGWINHYIFLPVFYKLQISSVYEYLELRYNKCLRNTLSFLFIISNIFVLPLFMYIPSLIFSQVSGVNLHVIAPIMIFICIFYTAVGGMKAVVWADTIQFAVTILTLTIVITLGVISIGGFKVVFDRVQQGDRFEFFNFNFDPTVRSTFWSVLIGHIFSWSGLVSIAAPEVQRFLAVSKDNVKRVLIMFTGVTIGAKFICFLLGLVIYAKYYDCDPRSIGEIKKPDQIVPYFITDVVGGLKGLNGLFVAAFFGAAFSTYSTVLNTLASVLYTDFSHLFLPTKYRKEKQGITLKIFTLIIGISSIGLIYLLENVGTIFEVVYYIKGITGGAVLGIYLMGLVIPFVNTKGAIAGGITSTILMGIIIIRTQIYIWNGVIKHDTKPLHTYGCSLKNRTLLLTSTSASTTTSIVYAQKEPMWLFKLSFQYYFFIGTMTTIIVGVLISWLTRKKTDLQVNPDYISPIVYSIICKLGLKTKKLEKEAEPLKEKIIP